MPILFLVGTPIGNLEDFSLRAIRILGEVSLIAAEDTRTTGRLLKHFQIDTRLTSYHDHSDRGRLSELLGILETGDIALVSEAGMPGLSDPGYRLIKAAIEAGIEIVPIPGPTAVTTALVSSGLPSDKFLFLGFLPRQQKARQSALTEVMELPYTLVLYEAPHRLLALLADVLKVLGDRTVSIGRELTKMHEEIWRGQVSGAMEHFGQGAIRGELTIVLSGASDGGERWDKAAVMQAMAAELASGEKRSDAAATVARMSGWRKRDIYELSLSEDKE
jgi:16S rRNA (cytidine1402-2'-O)-methyltransferase